MLNKYNLIIKSFIDPSNPKPELGGIYISEKETVATSSFILVRVQTPKIDIREFPMLQKRKPLKKFKPFILPRKQAEKILKLLPKNETMPIVENVAIMKQNKKEVEFGMTDLESTNFLKGNVIEGNFPNYKDILPKKGRHIKITMDSQLLKKIVLFANEFMQGQPYSEIELECPVEKNAPVRFNCVRSIGENKQKAEMIIMPIKQE